MEEQEKCLNAIGKQFGGVPAGEEYGRLGNQLIYIAAYLRVCLIHGLIKQPSIFLGFGIGI